MVMIRVAHSKMIRRVMMVENCFNVSVCSTGKAQRQATDIEPSPDHPGSVLIELQPLDVVQSEGKSASGQDRHQTNPRLDIDATAHGLSCDHKRSHVRKHCK